MSYTLNNFIAVVFIFSSLENIQNFHVALPYTCVHRRIFLLWLYTLQPKYMFTISTAQVLDKDKLTLQHPEVQYLRRVEFQGRARLPSSIAASQHVHLTPHLKQRVVHTSAGQSCQALPVKLVGRRYRHGSLEAVEEEKWRSRVKIRRGG